MTCMLIAHLIVASNQVFTYNHFHSIYEVINNIELADRLGNPEKEMSLPLLLQTIYFSKTVKNAWMTTYIDFPLHNSTGKQYPHWPP